MQFLGDFVIETSSETHPQTHLWSCKSAKNSLLHIPHDQLEHVYQKYTEYISTSGQSVIQDPNVGTNGIIEKIHASKFRFFLDIDLDLNTFDATDGLLPASSCQDIAEHMKILVQDVHRTMTTLLVDKTLVQERVVAMRTVYTLHIHYPNVIVTKSSANKLRTAVIDGLKQIDRWKQLMESTKGSVIDGHVYSTGLRLLWSHKGILQQKKTKEKFDKHVQRFGRETWSNIYRVCDPNTFQPKSDFEFQDLWRCSIFALGDVSESKLTIGLDPIFEMLGTGPDALEGSNSTSLFPMTVKWLTEKFNHVINPRKAKIFPGRSIVFPLTTRECHAAGRSHSSNHQFIKITPSGAKQMCHSCQVPTRSARGKIPGNVYRELQENGVFVSASVAQTLSLGTESVVGDEVTVCNDEDQETVLKNEWALFATKHVQLDPTLQQPVFQKMPIGYCYNLGNGYKCCKCGESRLSFWIIESGKMYLQCHNCLAILPENVPKTSGKVFQGSVNSKFQEIDVDVAFEKIQFTGNKEIDSALFDALAARTYPMAKFIWCVAREKFNVTEDGTWYEFVEHRWVRDRQGSFVTYLSEHIASYFRLAKDRYAEVTVDPELARQQASKINLIIGMLIDVPTKDKIVKECVSYFGTHDYFADKDNNLSFSKKLDTKKNLLGFSNGVFDLDTMHFRDGIPSDLITMTCGYPFPQYSDEGIREKMIEFIYSIQPHAAEREYMLMHLASTLHGQNCQELFTIFTNSGRGGKSSLGDLLKFTFGDYFASISAEFLTRERNGSSTASPDLMALREKRLVIASEPRACEKINTAFVKLLTGNDQVTGRKLHSNRIESFVPQFQLILLANDVPLFDVTDPAILMRSRILEFPTTFVANPTLPHHRKVNEQLKTELPTFKEEFLLYLLEYYTKYVENGKKLVAPVSVMSLVNEHGVASNPVEQFFQNRTQESEEDILLSTLFDSFKLWYSVNFNNKAMNVNLFRKQIQRLALMEKIDNEWYVKNRTVME